MCDPMSMAVAALSVGQNVAGFVGGRKAAKAQNKVLAANHAQEQAFVRDLRAYNQRVFASNMRQNLLRQMEEQTAATFQKDEVIRAARSAAAQTQVALAESGLEGQSHDLLQGDILRQRGEAEGMIDLNLGAVLRQLQDQAAGLEPDPVADPARPQFARGPSVIGAILGIGQAVAGGVQSNMAMTGNTPGQAFSSLVSGGGFSTSKAGVTPTAPRVTRPAASAPTVLSPRVTAPSVASKNTIPRGGLAGSTKSVPNSTLRASGLY